MEEKRKYPRFDVEAQIRFNKAEDVKNPLNGFVKDISAEGFCFACNEELSAGDILNIEVIEAHDPEIPLFVRGEVVWTKPNPEAHSGQSKAKFLTGIKIIGIRDTDEARFTMYYCERVISELKKYYRL